MMKRSLVVGSVALFLAALITLTGCPTSTDSTGSSTIVYGHRIYGTAVSPYQVQLAIDNAIKAGEPVILENGLSIVAGELNFKNAQVRIAGEVDVTDVTVNVTDAAVSWDPAGKITGAGAYIHRESISIEDKIDPDVVVWFAETLEGIRPTATAAAVREFTLGAKQNYDYSRNSSGVDAQVTATALDTLYVLDKLTIPSDATVPTINIVALGTVDVTGNTAVTVGELTVIKLGTSSTLTSSRGATIPIYVNSGAITVPNVRIEADKDITLTGTGALTIPGNLTGSGALVLGSTVGNIAVAGGDGNFKLSGSSARKLTIGSTGKVAFSTDAVTISDESVIYSDVVFGSDVPTITLSGSLDLHGNVTLGSGQVITLANGELVTLGAGKTVALQVVTDKTNRVIPADILAAGDNAVVLTPGGATTLTAAGSPKDTEEAIAAAKRITLGAATLEITDGTLRVLPGATLGIDGVALTTKASGTDKEFGYLAVAEGGSLAVVNVSAAVTIGTNISIATPFNFTAAGGAVTLGNSRIAGSAAGTKVAPGKGSAAITVGAATAILTLEEVELDVASNSGLSITTAGGKAALDKGAKITLNAGANGQATERTNITLAGISGVAFKLTGGFVGLTDPAATTSQAVWSVAHKGGDAAQVDITAAAASVTLGKSPKATFTP